MKVYSVINSWKYGDDEQYEFDLFETKEKAKAFFQSELDKAIVDYRLDDLKDKILGEDYEYDVEEDYADYYNYHNYDRFTIWVEEKEVE